MKEFLESFYAATVEFQKGNVWLILFAMALITGFFLFFALRLEVDSTLEQQLREQDDFLSLKKVVSKEFSGTDYFFIAVQVDSRSSIAGTVVDLRSPEVLSAVRELEKQLLKEPEISSVSSAASVFWQRFGRLPESLEESRRWLGLLGPQAKGLFNKDFSALVVRVGVNIPSKLGSVDAVEKKVNEKVSLAPLPYGVTAVLTGFPTLLNRIIKLMISDNISTMAITFAFVFLVLLFLYRRLSTTLIVIIPVAVSIIWLAGSMELLGINISVANATVAALIIGLGVDYSIHLVNSFNVNISKGEKKPITKTMVVLGAALFISFLTTFAGFFVNFFGYTDATKIQGITLSLGILYSFICTMVLIPVLLKLKIEILRVEEGDEKWK